MKNQKLILVLCVIALSGCTLRMADMTVASTKNYNINASYFEKGKRVIGEDTYPVSLFPLGIPNVKEAIDRAIEQDRCAVGLSDVVISQLNHAFLIGQIGYRVEGNLIIDPTQPGCGGRQANTINYQPTKSSAIQGIERRTINSQSENLSYEEYMQRQREINNQQ